MTKKRKREEVSFDTKTMISQKLAEFNASTDKEYTFEANLSKAERKVVHTFCLKYGMKSKSSGNKGRCVTVHKKEKKVDSTPQKKVSAITKMNRNGQFQKAQLSRRGKRNPQNPRGQRDKQKKENENLTHLTFSEEGKSALQNLFMYYPPHEEDMDQRMFGDHSKKTVKRRYTSDIFCKPSLTKEEITRKLKLVNRKRECDAGLRMITTMRNKLPIASFKDSIVSTVESNQIVLISGETGCGKTTQVPQYILDYMWSKGETCKIVCTQPRRISATSVAERVADERGEPIGEDIGYTIRLDKKGGKHSSVVFCTNGVLLQVLVSRGSDRGGNGPSNPYAKDDVSDLTHIIVDEIHERDRFSDFMLAILRDVLPLYPHLRLILMSATLDAERFSEYFGGCPIIRVPGFTYPVKNFYLEDVLSILNYSTDDKNLYSAKLTVPTKDSKLAEDKVVSYHTVQKSSEVSKLSEEDRVALDEAIDLAWSTDEFGPLLDLISSEGSTDFFNHQHSLTGLTPLMVFAGKGRVGDICMLLCFGVDCTLKAKDGTTALDLAERENQLGAADVIKRRMPGSNRCENPLVSADIIKRPVEGSSECENQLVAADVIERPVEEQKLLDEYLKSTNPILIDIVLIVGLLKKICNSSSEGAILIFLPGWEDITKIRDKLLADSFFEDSSKFTILPLHSMVPAAEQKLVFKRQKSGCRKIVLSTNMAETSVTIDDIVYVIDSGRMKEKSYDPVCNVATLQTTWVSKASAKQRAGRAGRCQPGICYHLYSKSREASLLDFQTPELKRVPVEELLLQIKMIDPDCNLIEFLNKTLDPPSDKTISNAILFLQDVGAMTTDEKLTEFGEKLGSLSVHPLVGRMLFFAVLMKCLDPALTLACANDFKDPFLMPMNPDARNKADQCKRELAALYGGHSDQLALVAAFDCFKAAKEKGLGHEFCTRFFLSFNTMRMLSGMRKKLQGELVAHGFVPEDISDYSVNARDPGILHAVLMAISYPMVGRLRPPHNNSRRHIEIANRDRVRLHPKSMNAKLTIGESEFCPTFVIDEIIRGDSGTVIKKCTAVGPLPLLLFANELAVAPGDDNDCVEDKSKKEDGMNVRSKAGLENEERIKNDKEDGMEVESQAGLEKEEKINNRKEDGMEVDSKAGLQSEEKIKNNKEDGMEVDLNIGLQSEEKNKNNKDGEKVEDKKEEGMEVESKAGLENEEKVKDKQEDAMEKEEYKIMSSADKSVIVHVDRWLPYKSTALDIAMVYCLRDHLNASILFTATRPGRFLPPVLSAAASTIAFLLSRDGLNGALQPLDPVAAPNPSGNVAEINEISTGNVAEINEDSTGNGTEVNGSSSAPAEKVMVDSPSDYLASLLRGRGEIKPFQRSSENNPATPKGKKKKKKKNTSLSGQPSQTSGSMPSQSSPGEPKGKKKKKKKRNTSLSGQPSQTSGSMPSQSSPGEPAGDPSKRAKSSASKPDQKTSAKPATLVGYGASRFGPYGLRGGTASAKRQRRVGARVW